VLHLSYCLLLVDLIALIYTDTYLHINNAMFEQTGKSGYVLKPRFMWDKTHPLHTRFNPWEKDLDAGTPSRLTIVVRHHFSDGSVKLTQFV
jgi:phosphatidylinositol phospholipase C epsilon